MINLCKYIKHENGNITLASIARSIGTSIIEVFALLYILFVCWVIGQTINIVFAWTLPACFTIVLGAVAGVAFIAAMCAIMENEDRKHVFELLGCIIGTFGLGFGVSVPVYACSFLLLGTASVCTVLDIIFWAAGQKFIHKPLYVCERKR